MYGLRWSSVDLSIHFTVADFWRQLDKKYGLYSGVWRTVAEKKSALPGKRFYTVRGIVLIFQNDSRKFLNDMV